MPIAPIMLKFVVQQADLGGLDWAVEQSAAKVEATLSAAFARALRQLNRAGVLDHLQASPGTPAHAAVAGAIGYVDAQARLARRSLVGRRAGGAGTAAGADDAAPGGNDPGRLERLPRLLNPATAAFRGLGDGATFASAGISKVLAAVTSLAGTLYVAERLGAALKRAFLDPVEAIVDATEAAKAFQAAIGGVVGGVGKAREIDRALVLAARGSALSTADMRDSARALAASPAMAARLTLSSPSDARDEVERYARTINRLAVLDPVAGPKGAGIAARELIEGDAVSLKRRFGLGISQVARGVVADYSGDMTRAVEAVKVDPSVAIRGLDKLLDTFLPPQALAQSQKLVSVRVQKLRDIVEDAAARVESSGFYDGVVERLSDLGYRLLGHLDSAEFREQAARVSASLNRVTANIGRAATQLLARLTGTSGGSDTVGATVEMVARAVEKLGRLSDDLPRITASLGAFLGGLSGTIEKAVGKVDDLVLAIRNFSLSQGLLDPNALGYLSDGGVSLSEKRARAALAVAAQYGIQGGQVRKVDLAPQDHKPGSADELFSRDTLDFLVTMARHRLTGDDATTAADKARDYVRRSAYEVDPGGVADPRQKALLARVAATLADLDGDQLRPGRANAEVTAALRSAGLLQKLEAARSGVPATAPVSPAATRPAAAAPVVPDAAAGLPPALRALVAEEYAGPNFAPVVAALGTLTARLPSPSSDPLSALAATGGGLLKANLGGRNDRFTAGDLLDRIVRLRDESTGRIDAALREAEPLLGTAADDRQLRASADSMKKVRDAINRGALAAGDAVADELVGASRSFGLALGREVRDLPPAARAALLDRVEAGTTSLGQDVAGVLARAGRDVKDPGKAWGLGSLPLADQQRVVRDRIAARLEQVGDGSLPAVNPGDDAAAIRSSYERWRRLPDPAREAARQRLAFLDGPTGMAAAEGQLGKAVAAYKANPTSETAVRDAATAAADYQHLVDVRRRAEDQLDLLRQAFVEFGDAVQGALEHSVGDAIYGLISGTGSLKDVMLGFAQDVVRAFSQIASQNLVRSVLGVATTGQAGTQLGAAGSGGGLGAVIGGLLGFGGGASVKAAAMGDVFPGGLTFLAAGGVVTEPRLAVVGERLDRVPEAVIPMLGRDVSIPLGLDGSGVHARLPGGRKVAATFDGDDDALAAMLRSTASLRAYADGGVVAGGANLDLPSFASAPVTYGGLGSAGLSGVGRAWPAAAGPPDPGSGSGANIYIVGSREEAVANGYRESDPRHTLVEMLTQAISGNAKVRGAITTAVAKDVKRGGVARSAINRPGR